MNSSDSEAEAPTKSSRRPTPVKALEALAKARQVKQEKKLAEMEAKKTQKEKKQQAVEIVATKREEPIQAPVVQAATPDLGYLKSLEEKIEKLTSKVSKPKKKVIIEDSSDSEEEVIIKKKKKTTTKPAVVEDPLFNAYKESQIKALERERAIDEKRLERDNLKKLFSR